MPYTKTKQEEKDKKDFKSIYYRYTFSTEKLEKAYQFNAPFSIVKVLGDKLLLQGSFTAQTSKLYQLEDDARKDLIKDMKNQVFMKILQTYPFILTVQVLQQMKETTCSFIQLWMGPLNLWYQVTLQSMVSW